jgi:bifunctional non-homologous end joining protein LigD
MNAVKLREYREKRDFKKTPEPSKKSKTSKVLHFVVQKHDARNLHYDFRLEHEGVLLSWAVPKGPSKTPGEKRLAVHVEDHPLDYRTFEGVIPKGNYGAGTVEIWDEGNYLAVGATTTAESEKIITAGMKKGHIEFILNGKKMKGPYDLVRMDEKNWLLIKRKS